MTTTRKMLDEAVGMDCGADGLSVQVGVDICKEPGPDAYDDLRQATPEELLEAVIWLYRETVKPLGTAERIISFLRLGFQLAQKGGWVHVAPMWLRESREEKREANEPLAT